MKKILVLGATGQLGTALKQVFDGSGYHLSCPTRADFDAEKDVVGDGLRKYADHDYLINCIAFHKVDQCENNPGLSFKVNASFVLDLARFCAANDITLIHVSTDYVFDGKTRAAYKETDAVGPLNVYGTSKLTGEYLARAYAPKHFVVRVSSMFGLASKGNREVNFIEKMVDAAKRGRELNVIEDQIMSPTFTLDAGSAIKAIIEGEITDYGTYHVCNSGECSWHEYARTIFEMTGLSNKLTPVPYTDFHTEAPRPQYCSTDNSKIGEIYPMRPWPEALREYLTLKGYVSKKVGS